MAQPTPELIAALRDTATRLAAGAAYNWTHQGACNCGHLAQTLTRRSHAEIHALALQKMGDWACKALEYCPGSGYPIDHIISEMLDAGLTTEDIIALERRADAEGLRRVPTGRRAEMDHRRRDDVVAYMRTWAALLEEQWAARTALPLPAALPAPAPVA